MSYRHAVRTAGAAALGLLLAVAVTPSASASPSVSSSGATAAESVALQRDLGLTGAAAQQRLDRDYAASTTDAALRSQLGAAYQGSWIDQSTGGLVVRTSDPASAAAIQAAGAQPLVAAKGKNPKNGKDKLDKAAKKAARSVGSWYVDDASATVVVESTNVADAQTFAAAAGTTAEDSVQVKQVATTPRTFSDLVGGQAIYNNGGRCSIGFSATSATASFVITAGHCTEGGGTWSGYNQAVIGPVATSNFPTDDFGSIKVNSTATWVPTSQVQGTTSVLGSTEAAVGASVCRSGSTTGYRCGTIQSKNATVNYGGGDVVYGLTRTNACAEPGDSGGSWVAGRQAQGMTSGGSGDCTVGGTTYFQPVNEALTRLGLTLVTG